MMAITTRSSISVKPRRAHLWSSSCPWTRSHDGASGAACAAVPARVDKANLVP